MTDKPMTVGELIKKLQEFDPNEPIGVWDYPHETILNVIWEHLDREGLDKRLIIYPGEGDTYPDG